MPRSPVGAGPHFDELGAELRRRGIRITWSRLAVLELLRSTTTPLTGDEIAARVATIQRDRSTAYQTLKVLESAGLVLRMVVDRVVCFVAVEHAPISTSVFVCDRCGKLESLQQVTFAVAQQPPQAIVKNRFELRVHGLCDDCLTTPTDDRLDVTSQGRSSRR